MEGGAKLLYWLWGGGGVAPAAVGVGLAVELEQERRRFSAVDKFRELVISQMFLFDF